ncbi:hypothetical protein K443DRAFT_130037 [Laccaria amethystina LaAM-08-1]|uniref:Uncharacterized protein n=1 Tax=Laccaria amethystina LaAM-08-1 TaxID=1095629 RepID=A0A0C9YDB2_9AGAR|nr:hypothetical protein K443DRAFT_130037 [Laccaria amethystina LaAM-08-1]
MMYNPSEPVRILNALSPNLPSTTQSILPYHPFRSQSIRHRTYARSRTPRVSAPSAYYPRPQSPVEMIPDRSPRICQSAASSDVGGIVLQPSIALCQHIMAGGHLLRATPFPHPPSVRTHRSQSSDPSYESSDNRHPLQPLSPSPRTLSIPTIPEDPRPASTSPILPSQRVSSFVDVPYMSLKGKERARRPFPCLEVDLLSPVALSTPFPSPIFQLIPMMMISPVFESFPIGNDDESSSDDDDGLIVFRSPTTGEETTRQEVHVEVTKAEVMVEEDEDNAEASEAVNNSRDRTSENEAFMRSHCPRTKEDRMPLSSP